MTDEPSRTAVVTGGSGGIGQAVVARLLTRGYDVHVWDREPPEQARRCAGVTYRTVDVADHRSVTALAATYDSLDLLVNAAGIPGDRGPIAEQDFDVWDRVLAIDLSGTFYCTIALHPALRAASGVVVNVASNSSRVMRPGRAHYAVAKAGVETLTRSLGFEWAREGIRVVAVSPGYTRTPLVDSAIASGDLDLQFLDSTAPRGHIATPDEVASVVTALAGDEFALVTGEVIMADGGSGLGWLPRHADGDTASSGTQLANGEADAGRRGTADAR